MSHWILYSFFSLIWDLDKCNFSAFWFLSLGFSHPKCQISCHPTFNFWNKCRWKCGRFIVYLKEWIIFRINIHLQNCSSHSFILVNFCILRDKDFPGKYSTKWLIHPWMSCNVLVQLHIIFQQSVQSSMKYLE